jgi:hypothetical protein
MTDIFTLELLPARFGDAIWVEYGDPQSPHRILIDGGARSTTCATIVDLMNARIGAADPDFELIVLTHIDGDHIAGLLHLFEDRTVALRPYDVWFNGWDHLPSDLMGSKQAERLSTAIGKRRLPWNKEFGGKAVRLMGTLAQPNPDVLPEITLPGGMVLTLLSPTYEGLARLRPVWKEELDEAHLTPGSAAEPVGEAYSEAPEGHYSPTRTPRSASNRIRPRRTAQASPSSLSTTDGARFSPATRTRPCWKPASARCSRTVARTS